MPTAAPSTIAEVSAAESGPTNAPGGRWYSTPAAKRGNKPRNLSLSKEANAALDWLAEAAGGKGRASSEASDAIVAHALAKGFTPPR